jgi:tRNA-specific 2-thiouridylase
MSKKLQKIYVGLSGGVDSSVTAALLLEQGYDVTGVYMKNWTEDLPGMICPWRDDFRDAKRVAVHLGIDFEVFDFQTEYKQKVVDYMIAEYKAGRTPNPDIMCNQEVKFKLFLDVALDHGADMIATGHYARTETRKQKLENSEAQIPNSKLPITRLLCAKDAAKDQTYFLNRVTSEALSKTLFPIGEIANKAEVRKLAQKFSLPTAAKKDSQGICFVGKVGIKDFLSQYVKSANGPIIDQSGRIIGEHDGAIFYTIGQRHGLDVGGGLPYYVVRKDMKTNTIYVTTDLADKELWSREIQLEDLHWISPPSTFHLPPSKLQVRLRYRGPLISCNLKDNTLSLKDEQRAISPGQSAVFYADTQCLGGGIISSVG